MTLNPIVIIVLVAASIVGACAGPFSKESRSGAWTQAQMTAFHTFKERAAGSRADVVRSVATAFPVAFDFNAMQPIAVAGPLITRADLIGLLGRPETEFSLADEPTYAGNGRATTFDPAELRFLVYDVDCLVETHAKYQADERMCTTMDVISLRDQVVRVVLTTDFTAEAKKWLLR